MFYMAMKRKTRPAFYGCEIVTALIYLCSLSALMMYLLCKDYFVVCTLIMTALCGGIYMLFYTFRERRLMSFVMFAALFAAMLMITGAVSASMGSMAIIEFIYNTSDYFSLTPAISCIIMFSFFMSYPVFYFTVRLPRPCFLLLPALAPLILGARTVGKLPAGLIAFLAAGYFVAVLGISRSEYPTENVYIDDKSSRKERLIAFVLFGAVTCGLLLIIPRSDKTEYANYLEDAWFKRAFYATQSTGFTQSSTPNTGNNDVPDDLLFYVMSANPRNVISQSFDNYTGKNGWTFSRKYTNGRPLDQQDVRLLNYNKLAQSLKDAAQDGCLEEYADELLALPDIPRDNLFSSTMYLQFADGSNTTVVRHPSGTYGARIQGSNATIYRNPNDEMFTTEPFGRNAQYTLYYYGYPPDPEFARFLSGLSKDEYIDLLYDAADAGAVSLSEAFAFEDAYNDAEQYRDDMYDEDMPERIVELADEITAGLTNDYDKVMAIENYFAQNDFVYDLNFVPQEISAEYFLFKSKRGICTDFATAATLLIRAAGIPARYTEGYLVKTDVASRDLYGRFEVKADQAHAFATAFVPGCGWLEIDGTKNVIEASEERAAQQLIFIIAGIAAVLAVLCIIFRKRLSELFFTIRFKFSKPDKKIRLLYLRTRKLACGITGAEPASATSGEVRDIIARILSLDKQAGEITDAADALIYGGDLREVDTKALFADYKTIVKARRARK